MSGTGLLVAFILKWPVPQAADFERVPRFVLCYLSFFLGIRLREET